MKRITYHATWAALLIVATGAAMSPATAQNESAEAESLKSPEAFVTISDPKERSVALFNEMGKVLTHPRCVNCHPRGDSPLQGMEQQLHQPPVVRGMANIGAPGMLCMTCHGPENVPYTSQEGSIPGHPKWHLAPPEQAWEGKSLAAICEQLKDQERSHKTLAELQEHNANDTLVGWGWNPGEGREPAPGTQKIFGALTQAWIDSGAHCP